MKKKRSGVTGLQETRKKRRRKWEESRKSFWSSFFADCAFRTFAFGAGHGKNGKMLIGYTGFAPTLIFSFNIAKGVEDKCKELGYEFVPLMPSETKAELQVEALDNAVIKGLDGLVIMPIDARALGPSLDAAQAKGIPVVVVDATVNHPSVKAFIGTDNLEAARMAGRYIVDKVKGQGELLSDRRAGRASERGQEGQGRDGGLPSGRA